MGGENLALGELLDQMRSLGWSVAVHNDYQQNGRKMTFWLFTHPSGRWVKGEGSSDAVALAEALGASTMPGWHLTSPGLRTTMKGDTANAVIHLVALAAKQLEVKLAPVSKWHLNATQVGNDIRVEIWASDAVIDSSNNTEGESSNDEGERRLMMSYDDMVRACTNIGYDLKCGACAAIFFTGIGLPKDRHDDRCKSTHTGPSVLNAKGNG